LEVLVDDVQESLPAAALGIDPLLGVGERLGTEREPVVASHHHARNDSRLFEHPQVARDGRLGHLETACDLADRGRAGAKSFNDFTPERMSERLEGIVSDYANYTQR